MKDLTILPEHLRAAAVSVEPDVVWPVDLAAEIIRVLTDAGAVVVGVDAWMLDSDGVAAVVGWSDYDLGGYADDRAAAVAASRAEAEAVLAGLLESTTREEVNHVGIDWDPGDPADPAGTAEAAEE